MRARLGWAVVGLVGALLAGPELATAAPGQDPPPEASGGLSPQAIAQIEAIQELKAELTPAERKVESHLLFAARRFTGRRLDRAVPTRAAAVQLAEGGRVEVDITATVSDRLLAQIEDLGGTVLTSVATHDAIRARLPLAAVPPLAQDAEVRAIRPGDQLLTNRIEELPAAVAAVAAADGAQFNTGTQTSEADATHRAAAARATFGVDGTGVRIGVLSDGVNSLAARQATGDLPPSVTVLPGQAGGGDEGTAMLELIHDLAPGAELFFATANPSQAQFAANILALRAAGCDIIVDDVVYVAEPVFQAGVIEQAVDTVVADGALYFSAAGNSGNAPDGTSGTWTGPFVSAGAATGVLSGAGLMLDWDQGGGVDPTISVASATGPVTLAWSDPWGASGNDYDVYIVNAAGTTVLDAGVDLQDGNDNPIEVVYGGAFAGEQLVVARYQGNDRQLSVVTNRGRFSEHGTGGASYGHNSGRNAVSVAAAPAADPYQAGHPSGPFPNPFTNANVSELFSSDGPRRYYFQPDGTAIPGGEVVTKPDVTAADGTTTTTPGFIPFFGTSAAAPHAAAIAALMMDANPSAPAATIRSALVSTAIDIEAPGIDNVTGAGIVMADAAVQAVSTTGTVQFLDTAFSVDEDAGAASITVTRTGGSDGAASVQVAPAGGTATEGADFTLPAPVTVHWAHGDAAPKVAAVPIVDDAVYEGVETVELVLQNPTVATLGAPAAATLSIIDDEAPPPPGSVVFSSPTYSTGEAGPTATLVVHRVGGSAGAASVQVASVAGGTATPGGDFTFASPQTVTWADGQMGARTVSVTVHQDTDVEGNETAVFELVNPVTVTTATPSLATLTIIDDDLPAPPPFNPPAPPSPPEPPSPQDPELRAVHRVAGEDRIETAIEASRDAWAAGAAGVVVLARSDDFADALVGVPLSASGDGPLLLTPTDGLDGRVLAEIERVLPPGGRVVLLGGTGALGDAVASALAAAGFQVERVGGENRFDTALAVAGALGTPDEVFLATGRNFPDALAAGAAAAANQGVVLLTDDESVPDAVAAYLGAAGRHVIAVGGPAARAYPSADGQVVGDDRYATAVLLAREAFGAVPVAGIATGLNFPDALSGGAHIAHLGGPLLLTPAARLDGGVARYLGERDPDPVYLYGGTAVLAASVADAAARA